MEIPASRNSKRFHVEYSPRLLGGVVVYFSLTISIFFSNWILFAQSANRFGDANALSGRAGTAGYATVDSISLNPANAAKVPASAVQFRWGFKSQQFTMRYPGFDAREKSSSGLDPAFPVPSFVWKITPRLGIGGIAIPFPVKQNFEATELPMIILGQQNLVDLKGSGSLNGYADLNVGYAASKMLSLGLNFFYSSIEGSGNLAASGSTDGKSIASFEVADTVTALGIGAKLDLGVLLFGISLRAFEQHETKTSFTSLTGGDDTTGAAAPSQKAVTSAANPIRLGLGLRVSKEWMLMADGVYRRADTSQTRYSTVDFADKPLDVYDTFSVYFGSVYRRSSQQRFLAGAFYEPSAIGPGTKGASGKAGYGFFDLAFGLGEPPTYPVWGVGGGLRHDFKLQTESDRDENNAADDQDGDKEKSNPNSRVLSVEGGLVYSETSVGIDTDGEQEAAYLVRRYTVPLRIVYSF